MLVSVVVASLGILLAYWFYMRSPSNRFAWATRFGGFYRLLINKYYVDEFYHWLVVRPLSVGRKKCSGKEWMPGAIDSLLVDGSARRNCGALETSCDESSPATTKLRRLGCCWVQFCG